MAKDRELTLKINLKPGDVRALKQTFKSVSDDAKLSTYQLKRTIVGGTSKAPGTPTTSLKSTFQALSDNASLTQDHLRKAIQGGAIKTSDVLTGKPTAKPAGGGGVAGGGSGLLKDMGLGGVSNALGMIAKMAGPAAAALGVYVGIFRTISSFVSKANPGAMQRMNLAWDDMIAVIGHALTPVIEIATKGFRLLGDFLKAVLPTSEDVRKAFQGLNSDLKDLRDALADIAPIIKELIKPTLALAELAVKLDPLFNLVRSWGNLKRQLGIESGKLPDSTGAAARRHTFTNPEEFAKSIYLAAANQQGKDDPPKQTADNTKGIWDTLKEKLDWDAIGEVWKSLFYGGLKEIDWGNLGAKLSESWQSVKDKLSESWESLKSNLTSIFQPIGDKFTEITTDIGAAFDKAQNFVNDLSKIPENFQNAINDIPNKIKDGASQLADNISNAIRSVLPSLPSLPSLPGGGGGGGEGGGATENAARASRNWLTFGLL